MKRFLVAGLFVFSALAACESEPAAPATAAPTAAPALATAAPATAAPAVAEPSSAEVPVPEDFEQEAATKVAGQNYRGELERIAREIEQDNQ